MHRVGHQIPRLRTSTSLDLLQLVFARPTEAVRRARAVLAGSPSSLDASIAHQVIGIVERDFGDLPSAIAELRQALSHARRSGSTEREADVLATFGIALVHSGQTGAGLAALDRAVTKSAGAHGARVRFRRGGALWVLGRHEDALADLKAAVTVLRRARDTIWVGRALAVRGQVQLALGAVERAIADFTEAERLFAATDQEHDSAVAVQNLGLAAFRAGDLPTALVRFEHADRRFRQLTTPMPELVADRCAVLLAAGLPHEALAEADGAIAEVSIRRGQTTRRAELLLVAGRAALAAKNPQAALDRASEAVRLFTAQRREWWRQHARLLTMQARFVLDPRTPRQLPRVRNLADRLAALHAPDQIQANLLAGRIALAANRPTRAREHLTAAAAARRGGPAITRAEGWLARALLAEVDDDTRLVLSACRRGLDVLDEHQFTLGASELRARATDHGAELADLALRTCLARGRTRALLMWSERWRATVCAVPAVRPPTDKVVLHDLAALRATTSRLDKVLVSGAPSGALAAASQRLERRIRDRVRREPGGRLTSTARRAVEPLLDELGTDVLAAIVEIDGDLHVLICGGGRVRRLVAGRAATAAKHLDAARWLLHRLAYGAPPALVERLLARLDAIGHQLEHTLLGAAAGQLGDGQLVIVPPGRFHAVPWALLPCLRERAHAVAPSATAWVNARRAPRPAADDVILVGGPDLESSGAEIAHLAGTHPTARVITDDSATASAVLAAIDGSSLAHLAAHGRFRADSPMFSSIRLADGPLTVYDFQQLRRAPYRIVLPCCDSGALQPVGADELLGLTTALLPLGTAGIVATTVPVNDTATVPLMRALHAALRTGSTMAEALATARTETSGDPVSVATGWSFVALGAA